MSELEAAFGIGGRSRPPQAQGPQEGTITRTTAEGVFFVLPGYSPGLEFGPAKWTRSAIEPNVHSHPDAGTSEHDHEATFPPAGATCLVLFVGPGIQRPWVVGWW